MAWKDYTVTQLKEIAVKYNKLHKIAGVAKKKRDELIEILEKITEFRGNKLHIKPAHGGEEIKLYGPPIIVKEYKVTEGGKEYTREKTPARKKNSRTSTA
jgi:hypothetical protein